MDWNAIKTEYITTNTSYRKLAEKYGTTVNAIDLKAKNEGWAEQRKQYNEKTVTKAIKKAEEKASDYRSYIYTLAYKTANKLNKMVEDNTFEQLAALGIVPRSITGAIKDLADVLNCKSAADVKEQEARIKKLQKEAEGDTNKDTTVTVRFDSESMDDYSK